VNGFNKPPGEEQATSGGSHLVSQFKSTG